MASDAENQTPDAIAVVLNEFLAEYPAACVLEDGKVLFDLREAKYTLSTEHARCTLHLWGESGNMVRRVTAATVRAKTLRLSTMKFGQAKPSTLEVVDDKDRRTPSTREATRVRYVKVVERALGREFPGWKTEGFRTSQDLEKSFGPAYARGMLTQGQKAWAVIGVNDEESPVTVDDVLTFGILWLEACRESATRRTVAGLRIVVPAGGATLTLSRLAWLRNADEWQLLELDQRTEELTSRDASDQGNLLTRLSHAANPETAKARFAGAAERVMELVPAAAWGEVRQHLRTPTELAFLLHGLEFARVRLGSSAESFNRVEEVTVGAGANETVLTAANDAVLREMVAGLCARRTAAGDKRDPLFRTAPERWLEGELQRDLTLLDRGLQAAPVYAQVPVFAAADRGMLDLLGLTDDNRLAVVEVKADEDPQLALQGLDYWVRVRWHHAQHVDARSGLGEFQRHGYFAGLALSPLPPKLFLVAPALRIHPATEAVLRQLSPRVEWTLVAIDERWRNAVKPVWRKRWNDVR